MKAFIMILSLFSLFAVRLSAQAVDSLQSVCYIKAKYQLHTDSKHMQLNESKLVLFNGEKYYAESITKYDHRGRATLYLRGGSERFIPYERYYKYGKALPFGEEERRYFVKIDKKHRYIIDTNDTIRTFQFVKGKKKIKAPSKKKGRFIVYEYE